MKSFLGNAWGFGCAAILASSPLPTQGALPISGRPVPTMKPFDTSMTAFMEKWDIEAGVAGIMRDNRVVYLRGFGSMDEGVNMPENAIIRQASATKPATAAAIRILAAEGAFGPEGLSRKVFKLTIRGRSNNGLLDVTPFPKLGDNRYADISVSNLLTHRGGFFPRVSKALGGPDDPVFRSRDIAADMGIDSPPSRHNVMRWTLGWKLQNDPGAEFEYSNFGYLVLGEIINQLWPAGYVDFLHRRVFHPEMWVPRSELAGARTLRADRNPREPWYRGGGDTLSVFDNDPPIDVVPREYGGYSLPTLLAHGGLVASAPTMLALGNAYHLDYPDIGEPNTTNNPTGTQAHDGALFGLITLIDHRSDGVVLYFAFNRRTKDGKAIPLQDIKASFNALLDNGPGTGWSWPTTTSDGFWVVPASAPSGNGLGGFDSPWLGFGTAVATADPNSRLRLKTGTSNWKGTLSKRLYIDAPLGPVVIGR